MFCLPPDKTKVFLQALKSGEINPAELADMTSAERRSFFTDLIGEENAKGVNTLFESKLLLKNQQQGMINWAKKVSGLNPQTKKDIVTKIEKMDKILNPDEETAFLEDIASQKLGADVTYEQAQEISTLSKKVEEAPQPREDGTFDDNEAINETKRMEWGRAVDNLAQYVADLKTKIEEISFKDFKEATPRGKGAIVFKSSRALAGLTKSLKASFDNSVLLRQGIKTLFTHPKTWLRHSKETWVDMFKTFNGKDVMHEIRADVMSRPNAINGLYRKEGLAVGVKEEAYPTSIHEQIPYLGKVFQASQNAFTGFLYRTRADVFDKYVEIAKKTDADITGIGKLVNSQTGRGSLGFVEPVAGATNDLFFSPRFLKSNIDTLTAHAFSGKMSSFARKQAAVSTLRIIGGIATILAISKALDPESVEFDPRSADFGKIKVGNTRFDVSGGMASLVVLAARGLTQSSKSSTTKKVTQLGSGKFGSKTYGDVLLDFAENKLSPAAAVINDYFIRGTDRNGKKPTTVGELKNLMAPIPFTNLTELLKDSNETAADILIIMLSDALGIGTNTYKPVKKKKQ